MASGCALVIIVFTLALCSRALAGPCIECKDCKGSNFCLKNCQRECPKPDVKVNGEECKQYGRAVGGNATKQACETTLLYCNGGQRYPRAQPFPVSLGQCANIAYGLCQECALTRWGSPCGWAFSGAKKCTKDEFMQFYTGEVSDRCGQAVAWIEQKAAELANQG